MHPRPNWAGRALAGIGAGAASLYVPRYIAEVAPISIRGGLATLNQARSIHSPTWVLPCPHYAGGHGDMVQWVAAVHSLLDRYPGHRAKPCYTCYACHRMLYIARPCSHLSTGSIRCCACAQAFICVGILVSYLLGLPYQHNMPQAVTLAGAHVSWWRPMFLFGVLPAIAQVPGCSTPQTAACWQCCCCTVGVLLCNRDSYRRARRPALWRGIALAGRRTAHVEQELCNGVSWGLLRTARHAPAQAVGLLSMPESPIWLRWKGQQAAAIHAEHRLLGAHSATEVEGAVCNVALVW